MNMNLNEIIVNALSVLPQSNFLAENGESIQFETSVETLTYVNEFETNGKWVKLENPVTTQVLNILTSQEFKVIPEEWNDYRDYSSQDSLLTIYLNENSVALRYLTNAGISEDGAKAIMQTIADLKQQKTYLTYGRKRLYTFEPCAKKDLYRYFEEV